MKRKIFNSRTLALILVLAMAVSLFTISASAATSESLSGHGSNISTITATGVNYETVEYATSTGTRGTIYDYYLAVPAETANGTELTVVLPRLPMCRAISSSPSLVPTYRTRLRASTTFSPVHPTPTLQR